MPCVGAVEESRAEESHESHELGLITSKVTCLQEGVAPNALVVSLGAPATKGYHARLGSTLPSSYIHGEEQNQGGSILNFTNQVLPDC